MVEDICFLKQILRFITARGSDGSIVFSIVKTLSTRLLTNRCTQLDRILHKH